MPPRAFIYCFRNIRRKHSWCSLQYISLLNSDSYDVLIKLHLRVLHSFSRITIHLKLTYEHPLYESVVRPCFFVFSEFVVVRFDRGRTGLFFIPNSNRLKFFSKVCPIKYIFSNNFIWHLPRTNVVPNALWPKWPFFVKYTRKYGALILLGYCSKA